MPIYKHVLIYSKEIKILSEDMNKKSDNSSYLQYLSSHQKLTDIMTINTIEEQAIKEYIAFKQKIEVFNDITSVDDAKSIAREIFQLQGEINYIKAGIGYCTIVDKAKLLQIFLKSDKELITYSFTYKKGT